MRALQAHFQHHYQLKNKPERLKLHTAQGWGVTFEGFLMQFLS